MTPFGDRAARFPVPSRIGARRALLERLRALAGVRDVVLCEEIGCVVFDEGADRALVATALEAPIAAAEQEHGAERRVRVVYDGEDLDAVAARIGRRRADVIALHAEREYRVAMLGFLPGFAYLRGLASELCLPRRAPRPRVPAQSVAIGAEYTGIYPVASAGGWHLLGRALEAPAFTLGDRVRFEPAVDAAIPPVAPALSPPPTGPHVVVTRVAGLALLVDGGRPGHMHEGIPPGGPLVRSAFFAANARVGNPLDACAIELTGSIEVLGRTVTSGRSRVAYLAVPGGLVRRSGPLRRGDPIAIAIGSAPGIPQAIDVTSDDTAITLLPGPDATPALLEAIASGEFTISPASDRAGTRLVGPALHAEAGTRASTPMIEGAIELTPSGLVVLGPDHPTTGGYPVVAVVASRSRDAFFERPLGARVRFKL